MRTLVADLKAKVAKLALGGGEARATSTWHAANCCRAIASQQLLDPGTPFLELSQLAAYDMYDERLRRARASSPASAASPGRSA